MICPECKTAIPKEQQFTCASCSVYSHFACNLYSESNMKQFQISSCDVCRKGEKAKVKCELCRKAIGLFKVFFYKGKGCWGHAFCMRWFPKISQAFSNGYLEFRLDDKLPPETWITDCYLCKKASGDFLVKCNRKECALYAHSRCVLMKKMEEVHYEQYQFYIFHCDNHRKKRELIANPLNALKTYGSGMNNTEETNSNIMIRIDTDASRAKSIEKDVILYSIEANDKPKDSEIVNSPPIRHVSSAIMMDKANPIKQRYKNEQSIDNDIDDKAELSFLSTSLRCEFCFETINQANQDDGTLKTCKQCLSWYHYQCEADYFGKTNGYHVRHIRQSQCYKCYLIDKYKSTAPQRCLVCQHIGGVMFPCNKQWIHYICLKALDIYFYTKNEIKKEFGVDPYKQRKSKEQCSICEVSSFYTSKCPMCALTFHPYCGFKANFLIVHGSNSGISFQCCQLHKLFNKNYNKIRLSMLRKEKNKGKEQNDSAYSLNSINTSASSNKKLAKVTFKRKRPEVRNKKPSIEKEIGSVDYKYLIKRLIKSGLINPYQMSKYELFNWGMSDPYFIDYDPDELNTILPLKKDKEKEETAQPNAIEKKDYMMNIDEDDCSKGEDYSLFQISKQNKSFYMLYSNANSICSHNKNENQAKLLMTPLAIKDEMHLQEDSSHCSNTFLSRKRQFEDNYTPIKVGNGVSVSSPPSSSRKKRIFYKRGFKLNLFSKKVLSLESQILLSSKSRPNLNCTESEALTTYITRELALKKAMLNETMKQNQSLISQMKANILEEPHIDKKDNQLKSSFKSLLNYQMISRWLKRGVLPKTFDEILSVKSLNTNMASKSILNKQSLVEKQFKNDSECCICLTIEPEDASPIVFCDKCNVSFHQTCYGVMDIPEGEYLCDLCQAMQSSYDTVRCCLCGNSRGAMKQIDSSSWGHVTCILVSDSFIFTNYSEMKSIVRIASSPLTDPQTVSCGVCHMALGDTRKCNCCQSSYHFLCAYFGGFRLAVEDYALPNYNSKKLTFRIISCWNEAEWNQLSREEQSVIRRLIYQKDLIKH